MQWTLNRIIFKINSSSNSNFYNIKSLKQYLVDFSMDLKGAPEVNIVILFMLMDMVVSIQTKFIG
jgi:hypothetical protein